MNLHGAVLKRLVRDAVENTHSNTLSLERTGEFQIRTEGANHCGTRRYLRIRYKLVCLCANKLDVRGFLFDQLNVDSYFQELGTTSKSCEKLTVQSLKKLLETIQRENSECEILGATLTLSPEPFLASMTYKVCFPKKRKQARK